MNRAAAGDRSRDRLRLDELLVRRGHFATRSRARDAVERGTVSIDGSLARKPGQNVTGNERIEVADAAARYVSRASLKLIAALDHFGIDSSGCSALDVGASTGGFTQVLLERGARRVVAVDVGHGQLHPSLAGDQRVTALEGLNARDLTLEHLGNARPDFVVADVSFISLKLALPPAVNLAEAGAKAVLLVKPQFEAGRDAIGKGGLLRDPSDGPRVAQDICVWLGTLPEWRALGFIASPIEGGDGNHEFLLAGVKDR